MGTVLDRVRRVVSEQLDVEIEDVVPSSNLERDLGADSLDIVELAMGIEEEFCIHVEDSEAESAKTVEDIEAYVKEKLDIEE